MSTLSPQVIQEIQRKAQSGISMTSPTAEKQALYDQFRTPQTGHATGGTAMQPTQPTSPQFDIGQFTSNFANTFGNSMQNTMNSYMQTMNLQNQNLMNQFNQGQQQMMGFIGENNSSMMNSIGKKLSQQNMAMNNRMEYGMQQGGTQAISQPTRQPRMNNGFTQDVAKGNLNRYAGNLWGGGR